MKWQIQSFSELSTSRLYQILQLRSEVFVVEQYCVYQDLDGLDDQAYHLFAEENEQVIAYARIFKKGIKYTDSASIGRVIIERKFRKQGVGKILMLKAIDFLTEGQIESKISISAQSHLQNFYKDVGFEPVEHEYLEDGIPHIKMTFTLKIS